MRKSNLKNISCPHCQQSMTIDSLIFINGGIESDLRTKLLNSTLFLHKCPHCQHEFVYENPFLYSDCKHKFVIYLRPGEIDAAADIADEISAVMRQHSLITHEDYHYRIVSDHLQLSEKLQLFEHGHDDRIMEICKFIYQGKIIKDHPDTIITNAFYLNDHDHELFLFISQQETFQVAFDQTLYDEIFEDFKGQIKQGSHFLQIDQQWVFNLIKTEFERRNRQ
ncbi:MAG: CpXC domain-containing protein [Erysipelotrichaceae bacterium]|nr:CpXC domain-containing protein [Erysipelotrichaceae bacterium]